MKIGQIESIYRFPVKSMLGECIGKCRIETAGIPGDRAYALIDCETNKIVSAKRPKLWKEMLTMTARHDGGSVIVGFPDGRSMPITETQFDSVVSLYLGRDVKLASLREADLSLDRADPEAVIAAGADSDVATESLVIGAEAPGGAFFDFAPIHIVAKSTINAVADACNMSGVEAIRYRPNLVVDDGKGEAFCENDWIGRTLVVGDVKLIVGHPTPRCAVPTLEHGSLTPARTIIRTLVERNKQQFLDKGQLPCLGVYAKVVSPGDACMGDEVTAH